MFQKTEKHVGRCGQTGKEQGTDNEEQRWIARDAWRALPHRLAGCLTRCSSAVADNGADPDEGSRPAPARTTTWKHAHCWLLK